MKAMMAAAAALVMMASSAPAQAVAFDYDFALEGSNGGFYVGRGSLDADATGTAGGTSSWLITGAKGTLTSDPGTPDEMMFSITGLSDFFKSTQTFSLDQSGVTAADFTFATTGMAFGVTDDGTGSFFGAYGPEVFGSVTLSIKGGTTPTPDPDPVPGAVPEPATWAMMLIGFGAAGAAMRRRRSADRFATA